MSAGSRVVRTAGKYGLYQIARALTSGQPKILMYRRFAEQPEHADKNNPAFQWGSLHVEKNALLQGFDRIRNQLISFPLLVPDAEKHEVIASLVTIWGLKIPGIASDEYQACTWDQLCEMQTTGIEIGGLIGHHLRGFAAGENR